MKKEVLLPPQIQSLINSILSEAESQYAKINYKNRLVDIRDTINDAIRQYDTWVILEGNEKKKKK